MDTKESLIQQAESILDGVKVSQPDNVLLQNKLQLLINKLKQQ